MTDETLLLRLIHPTQVDDETGLPSSNAFKPSGKDGGKLSVYNGDKFTLDNCLNHYIMQSDSNKAKGIAGVTVEECNDNALPTEEDNDPFDGHCSIDFNGFSNGQKKKLAKELKRLANNRGWLY